jgi:monofunctional biosynthetic peptidoglycan transglycosylase
MLCEEKREMKWKGTLAAGIVVMLLIRSFGSDMKSMGNTDPMEKAGSSAEWYVVNDGVVGGVSRSRVIITDRKTLRFSGVVSLENNGGFASIRHDAQVFDIGRGDGIRLRLKGDGKKYQLRVRTSNQFDGTAYKADFTTVKGAWQDLRIPWDQFQATYRGRIIRNAPALIGHRIRQIGFLIADHQEGPFELEVDGIGSF